MSCGVAEDYSWFLLNIDAVFFFPKAAFRGSSLKACFEKKKNVILH